jgi:lipoate-protein ligase B
VAHEYLGKIALSRALARQEDAFGRVRAGGPDLILGFEADPPAITLGVRGNQGEDLLQPAEELRQAGFDLLQLDRGGQATLHGPGQLVIFPVVNIRRVGARAWVELLARVTRLMARRLAGQELRWNEAQPGLYENGDKIVAVGVRLRQGVSTHGLAINIRNDLGAFSRIRACGQAGARLGRLRTDLGLKEAFEFWCACFQEEFSGSIGTG